MGLVASFAPGLVPELESGTSHIAHFLQRPAVLALDRVSVNATDLEMLGDMLLREFSRSAPGRHVALRGLIAAILANVMRLMRRSDTGDRGAAAPECELVARFRRLVELRYREHCGLAAEDTETMGSMGAPGFDFGWAPAISFTSDISSRKRSTASGLSR